jgi:hypothetical protein
MTALAPTRQLSLVAPAGVTHHELGLLARCASRFANFLPYWHFKNRETGQVCTFGLCPLHGDAHPGELWPGQQQFVTEAERNPWLFALKAGKLGFTELECAFDYWVLRFRQANARVHLFSMGLKSAQDLRGYVRFGHDHLPPWMQLPMADDPGADTTTTLTLDAGPDDKRKLVCYPSSQNVSIDQTATHTHVDELARMPFPEQTWTAIESTIADVPDATCHIVTRGAGLGNYSAELWNKAMRGESRLYALFVPWQERPGRDAAWRAREVREHTELGVKQFAPETWQDAIAGASSDTVVPLPWFQECIGAPWRKVQGGGTLCLGVDVARFGSDKTALAVTSDTDVVGIEEQQGLSTMQIVGYVLNMIAAHGIKAVAVDDNGVGGGVTDRLLEVLGSPENELDFLVVPIVAQEKAQDALRFHNRASELWWRVRERADPDAPLRLSLPPHHPLLHRLEAQVCSARYGYDTHGSEGRIWVDKTGRGRFGQRDVGEAESPDLADALCLAFEGWAVYHATRRERANTGRRYLQESHLGRPA